MGAAAAPSAQQEPPCGQAAPGVTRRLWQHAFGEMLIETHPDGSVWIDGKPVADTLPGREGAAPQEAQALELSPAVPAQQEPPAVPARE